MELCPQYGTRLFGKTHPTYDGGVFVFLMLLFFAWSVLRTIKVFIVVRQKLMLALMPRASRTIIFQCGAYNDGAARGVPIPQL